MNWATANFNAINTLRQKETQMTKAQFQDEIFRLNGQDPRINSFAPPLHSDFDPTTMPCQGLPIKKVTCPNCSHSFTTFESAKAVTCMQCQHTFYCSNPEPVSATVGVKDEEVLSLGGTKFETGAVRSSDKAGVQYHLISPIGMRRLAETHREGTGKYGLWNWERGMPIGDLLNHAIAHLYAFLSGVPSVDAKTGKVEDDLAHAAWNIFAAMHMEETMPHIAHELRPNHPLSVKSKELNEAFEQQISELLGTPKPWPEADISAVLKAEIKTLEQELKNLRDGIDEYNAILNNPKDEQVNAEARKAQLRGVLDIETGLMREVKDGKFTGRTYQPDISYQDTYVPWKPKPGDVVAKSSDPHTPVGVVQVSEVPKNESTAPIIDELPNEPIPPYDPTFVDGQYFPPRYSISPGIHVHNEATKEELIAWHVAQLEFLNS